MRKQAQLPALKTLVSYWTQSYSRDLRLTCSQRRSADTHTCAYGKTLLQFELGEAAYSHILNGYTRDNAEGHFTCCTAQSSSVVDNFLASKTLQSSHASNGYWCAASDHRPLMLQMSLQASSCDEADIRPQIPATEIVVTFEKIRFDASKLQLYRNDSSTVF